jgi:hypothetical protein
MSKARTRAASFAGSPGVDKVLTSDAVGVGSWQVNAPAPTITSFQYSDGASATAEKTVVGLVSVSCTTQTSTTVLVPGASLGIQIGMVVAGTGIPVGATVVSVIEDTSFVLSAAATASATVTLTFGGAVTITGTNFDSVLGGGSANIAVTFDGTSATSISVNSLKTIITCTPPAHAAGTITLLVTNASGLTASTNFIYDVEPIFTTAAGSLGSFVDGVFTADASAPRMQGTESGVALTTGFQRVTSATDDTVITTAIQGLTVLTSGYLTGTLSASAGSTYPFYATAKDNEDQRTAPRLFNIISRAAYPTGATGSVITSGGYRYHVFTASGTFTTFATQAVDIMLVGAGGGAGGAHGGGGGAGALVWSSGYSLSTAAYSITLATSGGAGTSSSGLGTTGTDTTFGSITALTAAGGGGGGGYLSTAGAAGSKGIAGGSGGGGGQAGSGGAAGCIGGTGSGSLTPSGSVLIYGGNGGSGTGNTANTGGGGGGAGADGINAWGNARPAGTGGGTYPGGPGIGGDGQSSFVGSTTSTALFLHTAQVGTDGSYAAMSGLSLPTTAYIAGGGGGGSYWHATASTNNSTPPTTNGTQVNLPARGGWGGGGTGRTNAGAHTDVPPGLGADTAGAPGLANTGGGGGSSNSSSVAGGDGGTGVVVIRYAIS